MLGSVADAEDVLQEAYLRWQRASREEIRSPKSYLSAVVTRLSIDKLREARARREEYVGSWLPEPLPTEVGSEIDGLNVLDLDETLSMAFLVLLESLSPIERAVFLLREVFDYDYAEISQIVGKSEVNCRQIAHRAHRSIAARRPRFESSPEQEERLVESFIQACTHGDMENLVSLLAEDVTLWTDRGGEARAPLNRIYGREKVVRFFFSVLGKDSPAFLRRIRINGPASPVMTRAVNP